MSHSLPNTAFL